MLSVLALLKRLRQWWNRILSSKLLTVCKCRKFTSVTLNSTTTLSNFFKFLDKLTCSVKWLSKNIRKMLTTITRINKYFQEWLRNFYFITIDEPRCHKNLVTCVLFSKYVSIHIRKTTFLDLGIISCHVLIKYSLTRLFRVLVVRIKNVGKHNGKHEAYGNL